jgi:hypothetical protein
MPLRRLERKGSRDEFGLAWNWRFGGGDGCIGKGVGDLLSVWTGTFCSAILARHYHCLERLSKKGAIITVGSILFFWSVVGG